MARARKARGRNARPRKVFHCSFCGKDSKSVKTLIAGPMVFICDECVGLCNKVLRGERMPNFPGLEKFSDEQALGILASSSDGARSFLRDIVNVLRARKVGWAAIGKALGVSRQAAWQRFS